MYSLALIEGIFEKIAGIFQKIKNANSSFIKT